MTDTLSVTNKNVTGEGVRDEPETNMRYVDFREMIQKALRQNPAGLTWAELRERLDLPYDRPCPTWVRCMEQEVGLSRAKGPGRAYIWKVRPEK